MVKIKKASEICLIKFHWLYILLKDITTLKRQLENKMNLVASLSDK